MGAANMDDTALMHEAIAPSEGQSEWESHDYDIAGTLLTGGPAKLEIQDQGQWTIRKGDTFYIKASSRHRLLNCGRSVIKMMTVMDIPK